MRTLTLFAIIALAVTAAEPTAAPTFYEDVLPILQENCQGCHRPGEAAPMSFLNYESTRPWAKAIRASVLSGRMPPWFADKRHHGQFVNERSLSSSEKETLVRWVESGAAAGDVRRGPAPVPFTDGWNIGTPDLTIEMPEPFAIPADGTIDYAYYVLPSGFTEDRWVERAEIRPGNRAVVHHVIAFVRPPGSKWLKDAQPGKLYHPKRGVEPIFAADWLAGYAPGAPPELWPTGQARLIPAGSDIVLQLHYTPNGKATSDLSRVGMIFAKETPKERIFLGAVVPENEFVIPAGAPDHRVEASVTFARQARITSFLPHMHLRGKSFEYRLVHPDGRIDVLLSVPRYDFNWQVAYIPVAPIVAPQGSRLECIARYDNSPNNPFNPDSKVNVPRGEQSWEEMMVGFFDLIVLPGENPMSYFEQPRKAPPVRSE